MGTIDHKAILERLRALAAVAKREGKRQIPATCIRQATDYTLARYLTSNPRTTCRTCEFEFAEAYRVFSTLPTCPVCAEERWMELKADLVTFDYPHSDAILGQPMYMYFYMSLTWCGGVVSARSVARNDEVCISFLDSDTLWTRLCGSPFMWRASGSITIHVPGNFTPTACNFERGVQLDRQHFRERLSEAVNLYIPIQPLCSLVACFLVECEPVFAFQKCQIFDS